MRWTLLAMMVLGGCGREVPIVVDEGERREDAGSLVSIRCSSTIGGRLSCVCISNGVETPCEPPGTHSKSVDGRDAGPQLDHPVWPSKPVHLDHPVWPDSRPWPQG